MRKPYRKHFIICNNKKIKVKDWMRLNSNYFENFDTVPTSEQIGTVLKILGYKRIEDEFTVIYSILKKS
ncbi:MAG: hypothetical protein ABI549_12775 [Flavobacterium sp.]|uniref:hypothetical protein n=1 Tax=Flavobacterium sp. TaxID=239 RepID=UPI0032636289